MVKHHIQLTRHHLLGHASFTLRQSFAHAEYRRQPRLDRRIELGRSDLIAVMEKSAPFRMADDDITTAKILQHTGSYLAGVGTLLVLTQVLRPQATLLPCNAA